MTRITTREKRQHIYPREKRRSDKIVTAVKILHVQVKTIILKI